MAAVKMVDGDPVEVRCKVHFHLCDEIPSSGATMKTEVMPAAISTSRKALGIDAMALGAVERARLAFAGDAVALKIA